jgi:hypothetical protein
MNLRWIACVRVCKGQQSPHLPHDTARAFPLSVLRTCCPHAKGCNGSQRRDPAAGLLQQFNNSKIQKFKAPKLTTQATAQT